MNREGFFTEHYTKEEKDEFFRHLYQHEPFNKTPLEKQQEILSRPGGYTRSVSVSQHTSVLIINHFGVPFSDFENDVLKRFGTVFEQTYTRFLDLQKAEAQAREAQIETALERIRSAAMAMHKTEDISEVVIVFFEQLKLLKLNFVQSWINVFHLDEEYFDIWFSPLEGVYDKPQHFQMPSALFEETTIKSWREGNPFSYVSFSSKGELDALMAACDEATNSRYFSHLQEVLQLEGLEFIDANYKYGTVSKSDFVKASPEEEAILHRFAKVFEQTYTRFLDLQKAEAQAREAQIEASLERIRAQAMAMRNSTDLLDIVVVMHAEFTRLGFNPGYFWHMRWTANQYLKAMTTGDGSRVGMVMELPRHFSQNKAIKDWELGNEPIGVFPLDVDSAIDYVQKMVEKGKFLEVDPNAPGPDAIRAIGGITFVMARTTHGEIGYSLNGQADTTEEEEHVLERFVSVFDLAYRRFEDLKAGRRAGAKNRTRKPGKRAPAAQHPATADCGTDQAGTKDGCATI